MFIWYDIAVRQVRLAVVSSATISVLIPQCKNFTWKAFLSLSIYVTWPGDVYKWIVFYEYLYCELWLILVTRIIISEMFRNISGCGHGLWIKRPVFWSWHLPVFPTVRDLVSTTRQIFVKFGILHYKTRENFMKIGLGAVLRCLG